MDGATLEEWRGSRSGKATIPGRSRTRTPRKGQGALGRTTGDRKMSGVEVSSPETRLRRNIDEEGLQTRLIAVVGATLSTLQVGIAAAVAAAETNTQITAPYVAGSLGTIPKKNPSAM